MSAPANGAAHLSDPRGSQAGAISDEADRAFEDLLRELRDQQTRFTQALRDQESTAQRHAQDVHLREAHVSTAEATLQQRVQEVEARELAVAARESALFALEGRLQAHLNLVLDVNSRMQERLGAAVRADVKPHQGQAAPNTATQLSLPGSSTPCPLSQQQWRWLWQQAVASGGVMVPQSVDSDAKQPSHPTEHTAPTKPPPAALPATYLPNHPLNQPSQPKHEHKAATGNGHAAEQPQGVNGAGSGPGDARPSTVAQQPQLPAANAASAAGAVAAAPTSPQAGTAGDADQGPKSAAGAAGKPDTGTQVVGVKRPADGPAGPPPLQPSAVTPPNPFSGQPKRQAGAAQAPAAPAQPVPVLSQVRMSVVHFTNGSRAVNVTASSSSSQEQQGRSDADTQQHTAEQRERKRVKVEAAGQERVGVASLQSTQGLQQPQPHGAGRQSAGKPGQEGPLVAQPSSHGAGQPDAGAHVGTVANASGVQDKPQNAGKPSQEGSLVSASPVLVPTSASALPPLVPSTALRLDGASRPQFGAAQPRGHSSGGALNTQEHRSRGSPPPPSPQPMGLDSMQGTMQGETAGYSGHGGGVDERPHGGVGVYRRSSSPGTQHAHTAHTWQSRPWDPGQDDPTHRSTHNTHGRQQQGLARYTPAGQGTWAAVGPHQPRVPPPRPPAHPPPPGLGGVSADNTWRRQGADGHAAQPQVPHVGSREPHAREGGYSNGETGRVQGGSRAPYFDLQQQQQQRAHTASREDNTGRSAHAPGGSRDADKGTGHAGRLGHAPGAPRDADKGVGPHDRGQGRDRSQDPHRAASQEPGRERDRDSTREPSSSKRPLVGDIGAGQTSVEGGATSQSNAVPAAEAPRAADAAAAQPSEKAARKFAPAVPRGGHAVPRGADRGGKTEPAAGAGAVMAASPSRTAAPQGGGAGSSSASAARPGTAASGPTQGRQAQSLARRLMSRGGIRGGHTSGRESREDEASLRQLVEQFRREEMQQAQGAGDTAE